MALASETKEVIVLKKTQEKDFTYVMKSLLAGGEALLLIFFFFCCYTKWRDSFNNTLLVFIGVAGMCSKTAVAPLDRIKILLQAHNKHYANFGKHYLYNFNYNLLP